MCLFVSGIVGRVSPEYRDLRHYHLIISLSEEERSRFDLKHDSRHHEMTMIHTKTERGKI